MEPGCRQGSARRRAPLPGGVPAAGVAPAMAGPPGAPGAGTDARPLFGGAVTALLPRAFLDVSAVRPVPDSQEVLRPRGPSLTPRLPPRRRLTG